MDETFWTIGTGVGPLVYFFDGPDWYFKNYEDALACIKNHSDKSVDRIWQVFVEVKEHQYEWHPKKENI